MIVLIVFTAIFQMMIDNSYGPLLQSLPLSLLDRVEDRVEDAPLGAQHVAEASDSTRVDAEAMDDKTAPAKAEAEAQLPTLPTKTAPPRTELSKTR